MKRVLITGAGSYVGTHVMKRFREEPGKFEVQELDVIGDSWKQFSFSGFDSVFHVAGVAHIPIEEANEPLYMQVNRDLALKVAKFAKVQGVRQFIFMSSASVYEGSVPAGQGKPITLSTPPKPMNPYGKSKLEAEKALQELEDSDFLVAIIRAPMIYGANAKGNFSSLVSLTQSLPVFPKIANKRSMLYIENLAELVTKMVEYQSRGLFLPQEETYICTSDFVKYISSLSGKSIRLTKLFNPILFGPLKHKNIVLKAFGDMFYELKESSFEFEYRRYSVKDALVQIAKIEGWKP